MRTNYEIALSSIPYGTMNRIFEIENFKINDMLLNGVKYILEKQPKLKFLDTEKMKLFDYFTNELLIEIVIEYVVLSEIVDYAEIDKDYVKVRLFSQEINVSSTKVMYLIMHKKLIDFNHGITI